MIPYTLVLKPGLIVHSIYNGYWFWGRPSFYDLWHDLRDAMQRDPPGLGPGRARACARHGTRATTPVPRLRQAAASGRPGQDPGRSGGRLHVVVDADRGQPPVRAHARRRPARPAGGRSWRPQRTQLYSTTQRTPSSVSTQSCRPMPAARAELPGEERPELGRAAVGGVRPDRLPVVPVRGEGGHDRFRVAPGQRGQVLAHHVGGRMSPRATGPAAGYGAARRPATGCSSCGTRPTGRRGIRPRPPPARPTSCRVDAQVGQQLDHGPAVVVSGRHGLDLGLVFGQPGLVRPDEVP